MKVFRRIIKWIGKFLGMVIVLIILAGLIFRLFMHTEVPEGELINIGKFKLHINSSGEKSNKPTVVIEGGAGLSTEFYHWLNQGLKDSLRVVRYDRAGLGYSDECVTPRDPETIAHELHTLLEKSGESPPYIMMGHSLGGPYIRVFTELYPDEVVAMFFLDATHHDHIERYNAPKASSFRFKGFMAFTGLQATVADMGILSLFDRLVGTPYYGEGLPDEINSRIKGLLNNGKSFRGYKQEMKHYYATLKRSAQTDDFGSLPIRSFTAIREHSENEKSKEDKEYKEFEDLSTNGKHFGIVGNHVTVFSKKENANVICKEVLRVVNTLKD